MSTGIFRATASGPVEMTPEEVAEWQADQAAAQPDPKAVMWERIWRHRDALQEAGCLVGTDWFHNDLKSRSQWERMVNRVNFEGAADADPYILNGQQVQWKTMAGDFVPLTAGKIRDVIAALEAREALIFAIAEQHRAAMEQAADPLAYDYSGNWPAVYEG